MTQEELKRQWIDYATMNMDNLTILKGIIEVLNMISNEMWANGFTYTSNKLVTCELKIKEIVEDNG